MPALAEGSSKSSNKMKAGVKMRDFDAITWRLLVLSHSPFTGHAESSSSCRAQGGAGAHQIRKRGDLPLQSTPTVQLSIVCIAEV